ncbi:uncharacterized protein [Physcomitrium patens]|uniref:Uncharacterized protein n=1 Tax=Physcomitrium patens TaxID=3218 RepID=A9S0N2_PHYPA|nr:uncharacterized protein LOC112288290 isoform X2 [Physcomitrium patens]XP_024388111.1 uncharacterized protein LOC112288290 isoform X2 [Physcomitrium patens]XP_024388112.1 uncharacterized protein LOC112288290 isoform X2 [Physcomitrium patens]XP_024388114.1 uncharacterized protein LOC112288290 isoform X2 [Physcomitrium patens]XP_024388115.1 uncharacterized protein LOC112288290 isoform X2 [Physcomitrium patens]PNR44776.1 hypothetical protein PHYPA_014546 [Physcomitrium patens]|eukprot:XP_024388110.1 uncharacterized protein LOC112288290 isoform X2 [Physcomitrella patens]
MGSPKKIVIGISVVSYLIAFGLALGAMTRRSRGDLVVVDEDSGTLRCQYTTDISTGLAATAFLFLLLGQMLIMIVTRCLCCGGGYKPGGARTVGIIVLLLSWICFIIASAALFAGADQNKIRTKGLLYRSDRNLSCKQVRRSLFAAAAAFTFITMLMTEIYYILISRAREQDVAWHSYGPSVGMSGYT